jgi:hypothetical protein
MPWQLSGNGRSDWSTKLIRSLKAEAAAGFQSRRERCRESTPVTPQYAAFSTYKTAGVHLSSQQYRGVAIRGTRLEFFVMAMQLTTLFLRSRPGVAV